MSESEKESFINFVVSGSRKKDEQIGRLQDANDRQSESLSAMQKTLESIEEKLDASRKTIESSEKTIERLHTQLTTQGNTLKSVESELKKSRREAEKYKSLYEVFKTEKFSQTSQSGKYSRVPRDGMMRKMNGTEVRIMEIRKFFEFTRDSVMAYRHDGRYDIDNSVAERSIRPLTIERKNSLFFGSPKGVETSADHTFIATCRMRALSFCEFLKKYFTAIVDGRTDYENLTPVLLG